MNLLGQRIRIRPARHEDLPFLQALWNDGAVMRYQGYPDGMHASEADMERWWQTAQHAHRGIPSLPTPHAIIETVDGAPLGELSYAIDAKSRAILDIKMSPACQQKGYAAEALRVFLHELFATAGVTRIIVEPSPENAAARRLLARTGFLPAPTENHPYRWECEPQDFADAVAGTENAA